MSSRRESIRHIFRPDALISRRYQLHRALGEGGAGTTFLAHDRLWNIDVALKVLHLESTEAITSFRNEFSRLSSFNHPGLCQALDFGSELTEAGPIPFYTAELIDGPSLEQLVESADAEALLKPLRDALQALAFLHRVGLRHGDFKPDNILVDRDQRGLLIDLSCAQPLGGAPPSTISGTPGFIAPELLAGEPADLRADLYGVGATLRWLRQRFGSQPLPRWLSGTSDLEERLLATNPAQRPASVEEVLEALGDHSLALAPPRGRSATLVGRAREMALFQELLRDVLQGKPGPRALLLAGPEGVGRSRLLREMKWAAQLELAVVEGALTAGEPVSTMLRHAIDDVGDLPAGVSGVVEALEVLRLRRRPLVLVLDDVHRLRGEERRCLEALLRLLDTADPLLCLFTTREGESSDGSDREASIDSPAIRRHRLPPLTEGALMDWLAKDLRPERISELHRWSGGFPSDVELAVARLAAGELREADLGRSGPTSRAASQKKAIARLSDDEANLLGLFAVLEDPLAPKQARELSQSALHHLHQLGWLALRNGRWALARGADAEVITATFDAAELRRLHHQALQITQRQLEGDEARPEAMQSRGAARQLIHLIGAGELEQAAELFRETDAIARAHPEGWRQAATTLATSTGEPALRLAALDLLLHVGDAERALAILIDASQWSNRLAPELESERLRLAASCCLSLGRTGEGLELLQRGFELDVDQRWRCRALDILSRLLIQRAEHQGAQEKALEALDLCDQPEIRALLHEDIGVTATFLDQRERAKQHLDEALRLSGERGSLRTEVRLRSYIAILSSRAGNLDEAIDGYRRALELAERSGLSDVVASAAMNYGTACQQRGDGGPALDAYERGLKMASALGKTSTALLLRYNMASLYAELGLFRRADELAARALEESEQANQRSLDGPVSLLRGEIALARGATNQARELFDAARAIFEEGGAQRELAETRLCLAEQALLIGEVAEAGEHLEAAERGGDGELATDLKARASLLRGRLLLERGASAEAIMLFEDGERRAREAGLRTLEPELASWLARACDARGAEELARRHRARARAMWERIAASLPEKLRSDFWRHPTRAALGPAPKEPTANQDVEGRAVPVKDRRSLLDSTAFQRFLALNKRLNSTLAVERVLEGAIDLAIELSGAERGFLLLASESGDTVEVPVARNLDQERLGRSHQKFSRGIAERVMETEEPLIAVDAQDDSRFSANHSVHAMRLKSVACVPIRSPEGVLGALYLDNRFERGRFRESELDLLVAFADQVAIAIRNARLHAALERRTEELEAEKRRVEELARGQAAQIDRLEQEVRARQEVLEFRYDYSSIIGRSPQMQQVFAKLDRIIDSPLSVLIQGESGTGKELVARAIHYNSPRRDSRFVTINCAALPETLLEVELFGCLKGAYTGADRDREGLLVAARGGTLLLDELGEMPLTMQAKLLRALQEQEVTPLGSTETVAIDVRVICATNRDLSREVANRRFRQDLYYRVAVVDITLPPLRERRDDIAELARALLARLHERAPSTENPRELDRAALHALMSYDWPGNVRELENVLARADLMAGGEKITRADLELPKAPRKRLSAKNRKDFERQEAREILDALRRNRWNISAVSRQLAIPRNTLYRKLEKYELKRP